MSHGSAQKRRALLLCTKVHDFIILRRAHGFIVLHEVQGLFIFGIKGFCVKDFMKGSNEL